MDEALIAFLRVRLEVVEDSDGRASGCCTTSTRSGLILDSFEAVLVVGSPDRALRPGLP